MPEARFIVDSISRAHRCLFGFLPLLLLLAALGCLMPERAPESAAGDYLFCFWNTENFFDNKVNGWNNEPDKVFDRWFADNPAVFAQKVKNLTEVLAALNDGKGPDILALAEVEADSTATEALKDSLNKAIKPDTPPYRHILKKNPHGGRNIVTAILTRLPVVADRTQLLGKRHRILEGHITVDDQRSGRGGVALDLARFRQGRRGTCTSTPIRFTAAFAACTRRMPRCRC